MKKLAVIAAAAVSLAALPVLGGSKISHGDSLHGGLKYPADFKHFDYVNPEAPKGGTLRLSAIGSYDSLNPYILKGDSAVGLGLVYDSLMSASADESNSSYGQVAETMETADDLSWVIYTLRKEARWHDGTPITADDIIFSFETVTTKGHPFYRSYFKNIAKVERLGPKKVKFSFSGDLNRELPHITGQVPVLPKAYYEKHDFGKTTLEPPLGSGPYRIKELDPGRSITYERVKDYWGNDVPVNKGQYNFDTIRYDYYRDATVSLEAFKAREYDFRQENTSKVWATGYGSPALDKGWYKKLELDDENPTGLQGLHFNIRRAKFRDPRVRRAIGYAFDFEWTNKNLFYGQYSRVKSYFSNSEFAATGLPGPRELKYLEPHRGKIPGEIFTTEFTVPTTDGSGNIRKNLRAAIKLLKEAGYHIKDRKLIDRDTGEPFVFEMLLSGPSMERVLLPMVKNLERLGMKVNMRVVDSAQYQNRLRDFDFDTFVLWMRQSSSTGNEQRDFWGSYNADVPGSRNYIGIKDPAVDDLIEKIVAAPNREELVAATRALDRVLLWNFFSVPQWQSLKFRLAYWDRFGRPPTPPKYSPGFFTWWIDPAKDAALNTAMKKSGN